MAKGEKPVLTVRVGKIKASVWENKKTFDDGREGVEHSIQFKKSFKDGDGQWKETDYIFPDELPAIAAIADTVYKKLSVKIEKAGA